jgi:hypothetical protein
MVRPLPIDDPSIWMWGEYWGVEAEQASWTLPPVFVLGAPGELGSSMRTPANTDW